MLLVEKEKTPWENGRLDAFAGRPKLLFGRMHEDWTVEASLFPKGANVFCIASAGCTAMALAALGHSVTAVDLNPVQIDYVRHRLRGGSSRRGSVDWFLAWGRRALPWLGLSRRDLLAFLNLENLEEQIGFWRSRLDNAVWRKALDFALGQTLLQSVYSRFLVQTLPQGFAEVIRGDWSEAGRPIPIAATLTPGECCWVARRRGKHLCELQTIRSTWSVPMRPTISMPGRQLRSTALRFQTYWTALPAPIESGSLRRSIAQRHREPCLFFEAFLSPTTKMKRSGQLATVPCCGDAL